MSKLIAVLVAVGMVFGLATTPALAAPDQETVVVTITETDAAEDEAIQDPTDVEKDEETDGEDGQAQDEVDQDEEDTEPVLTPDSPFYFLKRFVESVQLFLTVDEEKKVQLLGELAEERARELESLQQKYADGELTEKQFRILEKALEDLITYTDRFIDALISGADDTNPPTDTDEDEADDKADEAKDEKDDQDVEEPKEDEEFEDEDAQEDETDVEEDEIDQEGYADKYLARVAHLQSIADRAPEAAQKGLARAMANALRQRERAIAKGKIAPDEPVEEPNPEETTTETETNPEIDENDDVVIIIVEDETQITAAEEQNKQHGNQKLNPGQDKGKQNNGNNGIGNGNNGNNGNGRNNAPKTVPGKGNGLNRGN